MGKLEGRQCGKPAKTVSITPDTALSVITAGAIACGQQQELAVETALKAVSFLRGDIRVVGILN